MKKFQITDKTILMEIRHDLITHYEFNQWSPIIEKIDLLLKNIKKY